MKRPIPTEFSIHVGVASLLSHAARPDVLWTHFPAGEKRDAITGARLKRMGAKKGWADFIALVPANELKWEREPIICFLEIKRPGEKQSPDQVAFQLRCEAIGAVYAVARSVTEAQEILRGWGALKAAQDRRAA